MEDCPILLQTYRERVLFEQWTTRLLIIFVLFFQLTSSFPFRRTPVPTQDDCRADADEQDECETDENRRWMSRLRHRVVELNVIVANAEFGNENSMTSTFLIWCKDKDTKDVVKRMIL